MTTVNQMDSWAGLELSPEVCRLLDFTPAKQDDVAFVRQKLRKSDLAPATAEVWELVRGPEPSHFAEIPDMHSRILMTGPYVVQRGLPGSNLVHAARVAPHLRTAENPCPKILDHDKTEDGLGWIITSMIDVVPASLLWATLDDRQRAEITEFGWHRLTQFHRTPVFAELIRKPNDRPNIQDRFRASTHPIVLRQQLNVLRDQGMLRNEQIEALLFRYMTATARVTKRETAAAAGRPDGELVPILGDYGRYNILVRPDGTPVCVTDPEKAQRGHPIFDAFNWIRTNRAFASDRELRLGPEERRVVKRTLLAPDPDHPWIRLTQEYMTGWTIARATTTLTRWIDQATETIESLDDGIAAKNDYVQGNVGLIETIRALGSEPPPLILATLGDLEQLAAAHTFYKELFAPDGTTSPKHSTLTRERTAEI